MVGVRSEHFRLLEGKELIRRYEAPILERPPAYRSTFCSRCGSPVPDPDPGEDFFEVPAGVLDDDPGLRPDKHIFVELKPDWLVISDALPQLDKAALRALRASGAATKRSR
jgi:hypothetical protein